MTQTDDPSATPPSPEAPPAPKKRMNSILIVDDEEIIRDLLQERISFTGKVDVDTAGDGQKALRRLEARSFDAVLTDIRMPGMSGIDLMKKIKQQWPETAVLIMSGYAEMSDTIEALRNGAVDFLEKPFEMTKVMEAVERVFRLKNYEYDKKAAQQYLASENRVFQFPNNLDLCPIIVNEVTQNLAERGFADIAFLESIRVALNEMIFNAIEHGNLGVTFHDKTQMMELNSDYHAALRERAQMPQYASRFVQLQYDIDTEKVHFVITDQGAGFDHSNLPDPTDPANLLSSHGRGILMTRIYMDKVFYNEKGNQVTLIRYKKRP
ncbi:MAG: response regulator [Candidatus Sumerlaeota bacterium]|nr:response regulator [Candidatus Sumerlaeota bacterium]